MKTLIGSTGRVEEPSAGSAGVSPALPGASRHIVARPACVAGLALPAILLLGLALRLWGIGWQLPWEFHPDEGHYVWKAVGMVQDGNLNPKYFRNPSLYTYLLFVQFKLLSALGVPPDSLSATSSAFSPPSLFVLVGRLTSALLGVATVASIYRLGSELIGKAAGLLGALLLAVCFLHVRDAHFATNDVPAAFFLSVSVLFSAFLSRSGRARDLLVAGLFGGLATSAKYNAGFFVAPLVLAYAVAHRRRALAPRPLAGLVGAGLLSAAAYLAGTPFTLLAWPTFREDFLVQQRFARQGWEGQGPTPVGLLWLDALGQGLGWLALGLALVGFILLARRRPVAAALLGGYPLAYLAFMLGVRLFFVRFAVTLVPFLCLAAGFCALELARLGARRLSRVTGLEANRSCAILVAGLVLAAVAQPLRNDLEHHRVLAQTDTRAQAYAWLEAHLRPGARVVVDDYSVRDRRPRSELPDRGRLDLDIVNAMSQHDLDFYRQQGYQYAVTSSFQSQRFGGARTTYADLDARASQVAAFAPTPTGAELPFDIEELYSPFHGLARYERPGPTVKIYALQ